MQGTVHENLAIKEADTYSNNYLGEHFLSFRKSKL
uniref:Uncharacterized protein n=1 Tax=Rhizophora mucronata TaxID=61149 RepID=A0A2P2QX83_RHIMU